MEICLGCHTALSRVVSVTMMRYVVNKPITFFYVGVAKNTFFTVNGLLVSIMFVSCREKVSDGLFLMNF